MKKKCFVTGGAGLIGLEICKELLRYGCEVHLYDLGEKILKNKFNIKKDIIIHEGSILDLFALEKAMTSCKYIFHLAAMLGVKYTEDNKLECLEINCIGTKNVLIAALLIHAAKIDNNYTNYEKEIIKKALIDLNLVKIDETEKLLKTAEEKEKQSNQIIEFTKEIKKNPLEFRLKIVEILWKIVYSDSASDSYESNLIRRVCGLLYISDKDSGIIKEKIGNFIK